jgi:ABC-type branched-subunit amino acid transport system ATPase component/ABC-type branched-subunit amino acid transport system permease subunit
MAVAAPGFRARTHRPLLTRRGVVAGGIIVLLGWVWVLPAQPFADAAVSAAIMVLALISIVVLTGWIGQISLAQAGIMGVGAFSAAQLTNHLGLDFPLNTVIAGAAAALVAVLIGLPALRIKGLYLAIATLAFQWMLQQSLLQAHWFSGGFNGVRLPEVPHVGPYKLDDSRMLYYLAFALVALVVLLIANLRDSKTGRAWFAIRGSEIAARTMGIHVTRYKLLGFAVSGFVLGIAGSIKLNFVGQATPLEYYFNFSILYLAVAVLAGIGSLAGAVGFGIFYTALNDWIFGDYLTGIASWVPAIAAGLLIVTILQNPGGVAAMREKLHEERLVREARKRMRAGLRGDAAAMTVEAEPVAQVAARLATRLETRGAIAARRESPSLLSADGVTIRFGGVVANDGVSLEVRNGEITGLIGPNGAGKTTFFNAVSGIIEPNSGSISFAGRDITKLPAHTRASLGMGRTFQIMRLFPRLTVFENVMIGTHLQNPAGTLSNLLMLRGSRTHDAALRERVRETLAFLGIEGLADQRVAGLPFGILRLVELARAVVSSPKLLLLDEPASGLDVSETDAFAEHLFRIREEMGQTILIIEHDMRLVMMISDYVYVLDFGRNLAEGVPSDVQRNDAVIAAYLGQEAEKEAHVG